MRKRTLSANEEAKLLLLRRIEKGETRMKTVPTDCSVDDFLAAQPLDIRRRDGQALVEMMRRITGEEPVLWGTSIVGFGS